MNKQLRLINVLIKTFGNNRVKSHGYTLKITDELMNQLFEIVNQQMFEGKLKSIPIKIELKTRNIPGKAKFCHDVITGNTFIVIYKNLKGDVFLKILNAFCHEMIHYYDFFFGKWSKLIDKYALRTDFKRKEQYVGSYNIHGDYFMSWVKEFKRNGVAVDKYYTENKVGQDFFGEIMNDSSEELSGEKKLEKEIYDSIITDSFKAVSVSKDHIYIVID